MKKINYNQLIKSVLVVLIITGIGFFFVKEFSTNWSTIKTLKPQFNWLWLGASFILMVLSYIILTWEWQFCINTSLKGNRIKFRDSFAIINAAQLGKYLPGKVWTYGIQLYWLGNAGFSRAFVLYVNFLIVVFGLLTILIIGFTILSIVPVGFPWWIFLSGLILLILTDLLFLILNRRIFTGLINLVNRLFKREIKVFQVSKAVYFYIHLFHLLYVAALGGGLYFLLIGIGFNVTIDQAFIIYASTLVADVIGFVILIIPAGIGVREGIMYLMLNQAVDKTLTLILPFASRIMYMIVELFLGIIALFLLRDTLKSLKEKASEKNP